MVKALDLGLLFRYQDYNSMNAYVRCLHDIIELNYNTNFNCRPRLSITRTDETPIGET